MLASRLLKLACQSVCAYRGKEHWLSYIFEPILKHALFHVA